MKTNDDRIDLSPLDPENDPERLERVVDAVLARLGPGLVADPEPMPRRIERKLAGHFGPLFAVAATAAVVTGVVLVARAPAVGEPIESGFGLIEVAAEWQAWVGDGSPDAEELLVTLAGGD